MRLGNGECLLSLTARLLITAPATGCFALRNWPLETRGALGSLARTRPLTIRLAPKQFSWMNVHRVEATTEDELVKNTLFRWYSIHKVLVPSTERVWLSREVSVD